MAKKAEAERAALAAGPSTSSGEPDPKKAKTDSAGEGSESAAAAGPPHSAGDGANKAPSDGSSGAGEKAAEGPPAVPVKVLVQRQIIML